MHRNKRQKAAIMHDFSRVRKDMITYGRYIFKIPFPHCIDPPIQSSVPLPDLPSKHVADELLQQYRGSIHQALPIIYWPSFIQTYDLIYREGSLEHVPRIQNALLYLVLAFGSLRHSLIQGQGYFERAKGMIDPWTENYSIDHAQCALLASIFLIEMNLKSAGWAWLGFSVRIAQDIGLFSDAGFQDGIWPPIEQEMRKRVWWAIYAYDRFVQARAGTENLDN